MNRHLCIRLPAVVALWLLAALPCYASFIFTISVDTSGLINHPAGPFSIEFQLNDGSGTNDGNNTALIGPFDFGTGSPVGNPTLIGGASGDLSSHVVLADNSFLNEFFQEFVPGSTLTFQVELSTDFDPGPQPDQFTFAILDCNLVEIPTHGPADALVLVDITNDPRPRSFASDLARVSACSNTPVPVTVTRPAIAEPAPLLLVLAGLMLLAPARRRRVARSA